MSTVVMAALGGLAGVGAFLVVAGLTGRQVFAAGRTGRVGRLVDSLAPARAAAAVAAGAGVLVLTGWPVGALLAAAAVVAGPRLLGGRSSREASIARTEAIAAWTEMVRDSIVAASGLEEAILATATRRASRHPARGRHSWSAGSSTRACPTRSPPSATTSPTPPPTSSSPPSSIAARMEASDLTGLLSRLAEAIRGEARMRIRVEVGRTRVRTATKVIVGVVGATIVLLAVLNRATWSSTTRRAARSCCSSSGPSSPPADGCSSAWPRSTCPSGSPPDPPPDRRVSR